MRRNTLPHSIHKKYFRREYSISYEWLCHFQWCSSYFRKNPLAQRPKEWEGKYLIVFSGRLTDEKNQVQLMRAILLSKHKDKIQLVLAGDGPLKEKLIKWVNLCLINLTSTSSRDLK